MIGGDGVYGAVDEALCDGFHIGSFAQRWFHFVIAVIRQHVGIGQNEVVGCGF